MDYYSKKREMMDAAKDEDMKVVTMAPADSEGEGDYEEEDTSDMPSNGGEPAPGKMHKGACGYGYEMLPDGGVRVAKLPGGKPGSTVVSKGDELYGLVMHDIKMGQKPMMMGQRPSDELSKAKMLILMDGDD